MTSPDLVLVGHPFSPIGMGEHARSAWRAFRAAGVTPGLLDVYGIERQRDADFEREFGPSVVPGLSDKVNFFSLNADEVDQAMEVLDQRGCRPASERAYNIIYPAWELAKFMAGEQVQMALARAGYLIPSLRRLAQSQSWRVSPPDYEPFIQSAAWSLPEIIVPQLDEVRRLYDAALTALWLREQTPQAAFTQAATLINNLLQGR